MMATNSNSHMAFSDEKKQQQRKPIQLIESSTEFITKAVDKLPPISKSTFNVNTNNNSQNPELKTSDTKKVFKWRFWWEKNESNLRIPIFESPSKLFENIGPKVSSLDLIHHKPGKFILRVKFKI